MHRRTFLAALGLFLALCLPGGAQQPRSDRGTPPPVALKVLMIGNSYSAQTRAMFQGFVLGDSSITMTFATATHGGWTTLDHYANRLLPKYDNNTFSLIDKLRQEDWDVILVQEQSTLPSEAFLDLPGARTRLQSGWLDLSALIQLEAPNALIRPYQTWPRAEGHAYLQTYFQNEPLQMHLATSRVYALISNAIGGDLIPVGSAFTYSIQQEPTIALHSADGSHPSDAGKFLAGAVLYAYVFDRSPYQSTFSPGGDPGTEAWLLQVADRIWGIL
ncbi:MAG: DUF4886 domain-containing protein [Planctomycetota bacterium]